MSSDNNDYDMEAKIWLQENYPKVRALDVNWTMERYDYPDYVRDYICNNWIKHSENNGGTYHEPEYHQKILDNFSNYNGPKPRKTFYYSYKY